VCTSPCPEILAQAIIKTGQWRDVCLSPPSIGLQSLRKNSFATLSPRLCALAMLHVRDEQAFVWAPPLWFEDDFPKEVCSLVPLGRRRGWHPRKAGGHHFCLIFSFLLSGRSRVIVWAGAEGSNAQLTSFHPQNTGTAQTKTTLPCAHGCQPPRAGTRPGTRPSLFGTEPRSGQWNPPATECRLDCRPHV